MGSLLSGTAILAVGHGLEAHVTFRPLSGLSLEFPSSREPPRPENDSVGPRECFLRFLKPERTFDLHRLFFFGPPLLPLARPRRFPYHRGSPRAGTEPRP